MLLKENEKKALEIMSERSDGTTIPAIRLKSKDDNSNIYAFLMSDAIRLKQTHGTKEKKWTKKSSSRMLSRRLKVK